MQGAKMQWQIIQFYKGKFKSMACDFTANSHDLL